MSVTVNSIKNDKKTTPYTVLSEILPYKLYGEISSLKGSCPPIEEIRCRVGSPAFITAAGKNIELSYSASREDMEYMTDKLCGGSLYAHKETLAEGFITLSGGIRVGLCGRAAVENGRINGIYDISSLNFRLPACRLLVGQAVLGLIRNGKGGVLVYSPPGVGKTTLLRSVTAYLASGADPLRVAVIDTRGELSAVHMGSTADILVGYPKGKGIEIATRVLNPQLIVCDEIGDEREAEAILSAQNCGVPLLASAHADSLEGLLSRKGIKELHRGGVFSHYVGIRRERGRGDYLYEITERQRADEYL